MKISRRSFLGALAASAAAAPLVALPTLEEIERLAWRRRFWSGVDFGRAESVTALSTRYPLEVGEVFTLDSFYAVNAETLEVLSPRVLVNFVVTRVVSAGSYEFEPVP